MKADAVCTLAALTILLGNTIASIGAASDQQDLHELVAAAEDAFKPVGAAAVDSAKRETRAALLAVAQRVAPHRERSADWLVYLREEELVDNLDRDELPNTALCRDIYLRLARNSAGLEEPCFKRLRHALLQLIEVTSAAEDPDLEKTFRDCLAEIAGNLPRGGDTLSPGAIDELSRQLTRLDQLGQSPELVQQIRHQYLHPNLRLIVPASVIQNYLNRKIDEPFEYWRTIGGASIRGDGRLKASMRASLRTSETAGLVGIHIDGMSISDTSAYEDGVTLYTRNSLKFYSTSVLKLDPEGIELEPFRSYGSLSNPITGFGSRYGGRAAIRARDTAYARHRSRRLQAQQTALEDLSQGFTDRINSQLLKLEEHYQQCVRLPLQRMDRFPDDIYIRCKPNDLDIQATIADTRQLAGQSDMPALETDDVLQVICHKSVINNMAVALLGGRTRSLSEILKMLVPTATPPAAEGQALRITLDDSEPVRIDFRTNEINIEVSGTKYGYDYQGESLNLSDGIRISLGYQLEPHGDGWRLSLRDNTHIDLPVAGIRGIARRRVLTSILARDLPNHIDIGQFTPQIGGEPIGPVDPEFIHIKDGWLVIGMRVVTQ